MVLIDGHQIEDVTEMSVVVTEMYGDRISKIVFEDREEAVRHAERFGGRLGTIRIYHTVLEWDDEPSVA